MTPARRLSPAAVPPAYADRMGLKVIAAEQIYLALPEARRFPDGLPGASADTLAGSSRKMIKKNDAIPPRRPEPRALTSADIERRTFPMIEVPAGRVQAPRRPGPGRLAGLVGETRKGIHGVDLESHPAQGDACRNNAVGADRRLCRQQDPAGWPRARTRRRQGRSVVHAAGYGLANGRGRPITPDMIFHLASCGKQFTGLGIAMLAEEGKLHLDDPVAKHLPLLAAFGPQVTIRRLLHHTSGIRDLYDEDGVEQVLARCERATNADMIRTYVDLGRPMAEDGSRPGDEFCYSNSGYDLLGAVIERVSGRSYHDFFQVRVFEGVGMKDTFSVPDRRVGDRCCATGYIRDDRGAYIEHGGAGIDEVVGSGSFYTTVSDLCLYDSALATNSLLSRAGMRQIFTSGRTNNGTPTTYGFGWYVGTDQGVRFAEHEGEWNGFYSYICRFLDRPLSIFLLSNHPELGGSPFLRSW
jgi:CubicO group peptidase (beta-lactamase class C family)